MAKIDKDSILVQIREDLLDACVREEHIRIAALDDNRMINGDQWDPEVVAERDRDGRPHLTYNQYPAMIADIVGDQRQNTPTTKFRPVDDAGDTEIADIYGTISQHIDNISDANTVRSCAFEQALGTSFGYYRLTNERSGDGLEQDLFLRRIPNQFSVYMDQSAQQYCYEDGRFAIITSVIPKKKLAFEYPDLDMSSFSEPLGVGDNGRTFWTTKDDIRVAEYYYKVMSKKKIAILSDGEKIELSGNLTKEFIESSEFLTELGQSIERIETVNTLSVWYCKVAGGTEFLEEPRDLEVKLIPIMPVFGPETWFEDKRCYSSLPRYSKDAQMDYNFTKNASLESTALQPSAPFVGTESQFEGHETEWDDMKPRKRLTYNDVPGTPPPRREAPPQRSSGWSEQVASAFGDIRNIIGIHNVGGQPDNARTGRAVLAREKAQDNHTYQFVDNLRRAVRYEGRVKIEWIPKIYDTNRIIRITPEGEQGEKVVEINKTVIGPDGEPMILNDVTVGTYDLVADIGPSFATQRIETANMLQDMLQYVQDPRVQMITLKMIAKNSAFLGWEEFSSAIDSVLNPPQVEQGPTLEDQKMNSIIQSHQLNNADKMLKLKAQGVQVGGQQPAQSPGGVTPEMIAAMSRQGTA